MKTIDWPWGYSQHLLLEREKDDLGRNNHNVQPEQYVLFARPANNDKYLSSSSPDRNIGKPDTNPLGYTRQKPPFFTFF